MNEEPAVSNSEITVLLQQASAGDRASLDAVFTRLYPELRGGAGTRRQQAERSRTPTSLVHEAWLRLGRHESLSLDNRRHFLACAARAMRVIVVDHWRATQAAKRGGADEHVTLDTGIPGLDAPSTDMLALDQALTALQDINPHQHEVVEMHFFGGVEFVELARLHACNERTVRRDWQRARAFLIAHMGEAGAAGLPA